MTLKKAESVYGNMHLLRKAFEARNGSESFFRSIIRRQCERVLDRGKGKFRRGQTKTRFSYTLRANLFADRKSVRKKGEWSSEHILNRLIEIRSLRSRRFSRFCRTYPEITLSFRCRSNCELLLTFNFSQELSH